MATADTPDNETIVRYNLQCSYHDRTFVRKIGGSWDPVAKTWYVTNDIYQSHGELFERWDPLPVTSQTCAKKKPEVWKVPKPLFCVVVNVENDRVNKYDSAGSCCRAGDSAEEQFQRLATTRGWTCQTATCEENIYYHIDFYLTNATHTKVSCDVKAEKKIRRHHTTVTPNHTWLELHGVRKNDLGWLFSPKASRWLCFQQNTGFLIFDRQKLCRSK